MLSHAGIDQSLAVLGLGYVLKSPAVSTVLNRNGMRQSGTYARFLQHIRGIGSVLVGCMASDFRILIYLFDGFVGCLEVDVASEDLCALTSEQGRHGCAIAPAFAYGSDSG
jgi:hypothetical protein